MESDVLNVLNEIYDAYKRAIKAASSMWISEFSCSKEDDEQKNMEDEEDLKYFKSLLQKINNNWRANNAE